MRQMTYWAQSGEKSWDSQHTPRPRPPLFSNFEFCALSSSWPSLFFRVHRSRVIIQVSSWLCARAGVEIAKTKRVWKSVFLNFPSHRLAFRWNVLDSTKALFFPIFLSLASENDVWVDPIATWWDRTGKKKTWNGLGFCKIVGICRHYAGFCAICILKNMFYGTSFLGHVLLCSRCPAARFSVSSLFSFFFCNVLYWLSVYVLCLMLAAW